jgi:hypothetical protein
LPCWGGFCRSFYTAGVIDYLLETLERWEIAKERFPDDPEIPRHRVEIEVLTGASAGGMCGGFLILQGHKKFNMFDKKGNFVPDWYKNESLLYDAWVNMTETKGGNSMIEQLLETSDMFFKKATSCLNSKFIDDLTEKFINKTPDYDLKNWPKYLSPKLEYATSLTNIDGVETEIEFNNTNGLPSKAELHRYKMKSAKDFGHFQLCSCDHDGVIVPPSPDYAQIPLFITHKNGDDNKQLLGSVMQATGAFPVGFKPRRITRKGKYIKYNRLITGGVELKQLNDNGDYCHWIVDGGAVNNEPFEVAAFLLDRKHEDRNSTNGAPNDKSVDRGSMDFVERNKNGNWDENILSGNSDFQTVLMIDPFPNTETLLDLNTLGDLKTRVKKLSIIEAVTKLIGALRDQPLVKPVTVQKSVSVNRDYSRFMLAPRRKIFDIDGRLVEQVDGSAAIACGALGGFSGFLDKRYREHDYLLGRFNCQHFIQKLFGFSVTDVNQGILEGIYDKTNHDYLVNYERHPFIPDLLITPKGVKLNQMNDYTSCKFPDAPIFPEFPRDSISEMTGKYEKWQGPLKKRTKALTRQMLLEMGIPRPLNGFLSGFLWKLKINGFLQQLVIGDLEEHGLIG